MLTTPQAPMNEQAQAEPQPRGEALAQQVPAQQVPAQQVPAQQVPVQQVPIQQIPAQPLPQTAPIWRTAPAGVYMQPMPVPQQAQITPTGGQRLGLAVASLALLIPLLAIAIGTMTNLLQYVSAGVAITIGLIATAMVCLVVVGVNILFNMDMFRSKK